VVDIGRFYAFLKTTCFGPHSFAAGVSRYEK